MSQKKTTTTLKHQTPSRKCLDTDFTTREAVDFGLHDLKPFFIYIYTHTYIVLNLYHIISIDTRVSVLSRII